MALPELNYKLVPGVRQNHLGKLYQVAINQYGHMKQVFVEEIPLTGKLAQAMERVTVHSKGNPGQTYKSFQCYQGSL